MVAKSRSTGGRIANVELERAHAIPIEARDRAEGVDVARRGVDAPGAPLQQLLDERAPDATVRTGDERDGMFDLHDWSWRVRVRTGSL